MADSFTIYADLETGGIEPAHPNIQIAAVAIDQDWRECGSFERKIKFDLTTADPEALKINHYSEAAWKDAGSPGLVAAQFAEFAKPFACVKMMSKRTNNPYYVAKLAGHNIVTFDLPRIRAMFGTNFFPFSYHTKDTLQRALWYFDEHPEVDRPESLKLSVLCSFFGIATDGAHEALSDVRMAAALARAIRDAERGRR